MSTTKTKSEFKLPELNYNYSALEPHIDSKTMEIHHSKHHQGYVNKLNKALDDYEQYREWSLEKLLAQINELPEPLQAPVRKHGGGHANHTLFWEILTPHGSGHQPNGAVAREMDKTFGSFEKFKEEFKNCATSRFGSGWAWLLLENGKLKIESTPNQNSPLMEGKTPILGIDVWEHAYYLKHQNKRGDWVDEFFKIIDWKAVNKKFEEAK